jgi:uncharacterized RDD family membrane protein YckC
MTDQGWNTPAYGSPGPQTPPPGAPPPGYQAPGYQAPPGYQQPADFQSGGYQQPGGYLQPAPPMPGYQAAPGGLFLDPATGLTIPQGTQVASIGIRIGAFFLSGLLAIITLGIGYLIWGAITWANGQTPTQQVLGLRCWRMQENAVASWGQMFLWGLSRSVIDYIAFGGLVSFVMMLVNKDRRTLYDHISGIVILQDPNKVLAPPK